MWLVEITVEGFKSFSKRTTIGELDPHINAVTGANGAGKSNILDAISFVLGITDLSQVRVKSLQELVYKQGQAGITKASVSLKFNNQDTEKSPPGYQQCSTIYVTRQVVIGGTSKYMLNGHPAQQQRVMSLFQSVGMNINKPQFLIMQGRISAVVKMNPRETVGMLEEAAGTAMYEDKKQKALKTIARKNTKMEEIQKICDTEIMPQLKRLHAEKDALMKYNNNQNNIDKRRRIVVAYAYTEATRLANTSDPELDRLEEQMADIQEQLAKNRERVEAAEAEIRELSEARERSESGEFRKLEQAVMSLSKKFVVAKSEMENAKAEAEAKTAEVQGCDKDIASLEQQIKRAQDLLADLRQSTSDTTDKAERATARVNELEAEYEALSTGMSTGKGDSESLAGQLMVQEKAATQAKTSAKQAEMRIKKASKELATKERAVAKASSSFGGLVEEKSELERELADLKTQSMETGFDLEKEKVLSSERSAVAKEIQQLERQADGMEAKLGRCQFQGSGRNGVRGTVAQLLRIKDEYQDAAVALEVAAGGALYNVVVDNDTVGQRVISDKTVQRRITVIPLNKIQTGKSNEKEVQEAKSAAAQVARNTEASITAEIAKALLGYPEDVEPAMQHVFGRTFICSDDHAAQKIAFQHKMKAVTLEGDIFDPRGTLTGGYRGPKGTSVLRQLDEFNAVRRRLNELQERLREVDDELAQLREESHAWRELEQAIIKKTHAIALLDKRLAQNDDHQLVERVAALKRAVQEDTAAVEAAKATEKASTEAAKALRKQLKDFEAHRDAQLADIKKQIAAAKKARTAATKGMGSIEDELNEAAANLEQAKTELESRLADRETLESEQKDLAVAATEKRSIMQAAQAAHAEKDGKLDELQAQLREADRKMSSLQKEKGRVESKSSKLEAESKRVAKDLAEREGKRKLAKQEVENLEQRHSWIVHERAHFGDEHSDYNFKANNMRDVERELETLEREQTKLGREMNKNAASMYEKCDKEYASLLEKKQTVENDRAKIEKVIEELDSKKIEALEATYDQVNRDFGKIFGSVLPGATATLALTGKTATEGLEMRVAFGKLWKSSLTELSGGQRSLLALSLVLALLRYKPAPVYILDEVDAALDLSHSTNIGLMLKQHFTDSQFLIVTHKEEFFQSANIVFRMNVVDNVFHGIDRMVNLPGAESQRRPANAGSAASRAPVASKSASGTSDKKRKMAGRN